MSQTLTKTPTNHFPAVRKAREALREKAHELLQEYLTTLKMAAASGEYEAALKGYQWLLDHVPAEDGQRLIDRSVDKDAIDTGGPRGPQIQIGIRLGGVQTPKELPEVIELDREE